jgi:hypothetical protein
MEHGLDRLDSRQKNELTQWLDVRPHRDISLVSSLRRFSEPMAERLINHEFFVRRR